MPNPNQPSPAPEGMPRFVYTQDQLADMPDHMREGLLKAQAEGHDVIDGMPLGQPAATQEAATPQLITEVPPELHTEPTTAEAPTASESPALITEAPLTQEQRADMEARRAEETAARAEEPMYHGGYNGIRLSQMSGAVGGPVRLWGPNAAQPPKGPEQPSQTE